MNSDPIPSERQLIPEVYVRSLERALQFYTALGFSVVRSDVHFAVLSWGERQLYLEQVDNLPAPPTYPVANIRVMVQDVDAHHRRCLEIGASIVKEIADRTYGLRDFTIADPDGFGIRFGQDIYP